MARSLDRALNLATLAAVGVGGWWLWQRFKDFRDAAATVTAPIAEGYVALTSPPSAASLSVARIVLPNGRELGVDEIGRLDSSFGFTWNGVGYRLTGRDGTGRFVAVLRQGT